MKIEIKALISVSSQLLVRTAFVAALLPIPTAFALQKADAGGCNPSHCDGDEVVVVAPGGSSASNTPPGNSAPPSPGPTPDPTPAQAPDTSSPSTSHPGRGAGGVILTPPKHGAVTGNTPIAAPGDVWPPKVTKPANQKDLKSTCNLFYVQYSGTGIPTTYQCYKNPLTTQEQKTCTTTYLSGTGKPPVSTCGTRTIIWSPPFDQDDKNDCTGTGWYTTIGCGDQIVK